MIVNFEDKFKSLLKIPGQRFLIDYYKTNSGKEGDFCAIWYKEKQTLDITIYSTDSINCNSIEVFWRDPNSNIKILAFTLIESEGMFLTNKGGNHFRVHFPETNSTILTKSDNSNTDYIEGVNHLGCNFFKREEIEGNSLITKASYKKFIRNEVSVNNAPTYLNTSGEKVFTTSSYKKPKNVQIWFATKKGLSKYYVPGESGTVYVEGIVTYDLYEVTNGSYKLVEENRTEDLSNTVLIAENTNDSEIEIEINQLEKSISYSSADSSSIIQVYVQLYFSNDLGDNSISSPMKSNVLELIQYKTIDLPSTSSNINPIGGNRVFLFDSKGNRLNSSSEDIDVSERNIHFIRFSVKNKPYDTDINELLDKNLTTSNPIIWEYFNKEIEESYNPATQTYTYDIKFSTNQENDSKNWYPLNNDQVSTLIPCSFSFDKDSTIGFYLVQGFVADIQVKGDGLYDDPDSSGNYIVEFDGKIGKKSIDLYVTGDDVSDYNTWNVSSGFLSGSDSTITKTSGNIETKQTSKHDTFSIISYRNPSSTNDIIISNGITISRYSNGDSGDWKNVMISQANKKSIKVILKKAQNSERVISTTPYNFNSERLFLFDHKGFTFENTDNPENKTHTIVFYTVEKFKNSGTDILKIGEGLDKYFKFDLVVGDDVEESGSYKNQINITTCFNTGDEKTLGQNLTDSCYPETPIESSITFEENTIRFYVIQAINIPQLKLYIPEGRGVWKDIENEEGITSTEKTKGVFRFEKKDEMNSYVNTDKSFDEHKPGDIISSGEDSILVNDNFKILVQTYKEANSFIFNNEHQEIEFILSNVVSKYKYWFLTSEIPEGLIINSTDKEINTNLDPVDDQYYIYPYDSKNPKTTWKSPHSITIKNTIEQGVSEKIFDTLYFTRINTSNPNKSELVGSWEYYMCNNNNEGPAILNTRLEALENSINIDVSGGDPYLTDSWKNSRYFPLDHIGIYCIMISCEEDFTATISSHHNNSLFFYDETDDKILTTTYSIDKQRSTSGTPIYICFLGEQVRDDTFNSTYSSEFNETLRISYRENSNIYKEVRFRRYYREGYPTTDGTNWGENSLDTSSSNYLEATLVPVKNIGSSNILNSIASRKETIDLFRTPSMDVVDTVFESNVELTTEGSYTISSSPTLRFANWSGNRTWNDNKTSYTTGINNGYQNTEVTLGSDIGEGLASYPSTPTVINIQHPRNYDDKKSEVLLYDLASAPILTLGEGVNSTKLNFIWIKPTTDKTSITYNFSSRTIYFLLYGPTGFVLESNFVSSGLDNIAKVTSSTITDLGLGGEASVRISVTSMTEDPPTENMFLGTYTFTARLPYNKFLKDKEGNTRTDYTQEEVDQLAGTSSMSFDIWLLPSDNIIFDIDGSFSMVPASGEKRPFYLGKDSILSDTNTVIVSPYSTDSSIPAGIVSKSYSNIGTTDYFEVEFISRQKRFGYNSLINLDPTTDDKGVSVTLLEKIIKELSGSYLEDDFSISIVGSSFSYNTKTNGGILQDKVKTGILIGWANSPQSTSITKWALILGEATIYKTTDYSNDCEYVFLASVTLPTETGAEDFTKYSITDLKFSTNHYYMSVRPSFSASSEPGMLTKENVIVSGADYNYKLYYVRAGTMRYNEIFYITDNSGNKLTFHVKQGYLN